MLPSCCCCSWAGSRWGHWVAAVHPGATAERGARQLRARTVQARRRWLRWQGLAAGTAIPQPQGALPHGHPSRPERISPSSLPQILQVERVGILGGEVGVRGLLRWALTFLWHGSLSLALEGLRRSMVLGPPRGLSAALDRAPGGARTEAPAPRPGSTQEASSHMRGARSGAARGSLAGPGGRKTSSKHLPCPGPPGGCQPRALVPATGAADGLGVPTRQKRRVPCPSAVPPPGSPSSSFVGCWAGMSPAPSGRPRAAEGQLAPGGTGTQAPHPPVDVDTV